MNKIWRDTLDPSAHTPNLDNPAVWPELHRGIIHPDSVTADLEPDILEREVKWALESMANNKASGGDGIPVELFKI